MYLEVSCFGGENESDTGVYCRFVLLLQIELGDLLLCPSPFISLSPEICTVNLHLLEGCNRRD
jgi:hypothetical protein